MSRPSQPRWDALLPLLLLPLTLADPIRPGYRSCYPPRPHGDVTLPVDEPVVVYYVSESGSGHPGYQNFITSLKTFGWKGFANVGLEDVTWKNDENNKHWAARTHAYARYAALQHPDRVLVFVDVFDVLFMQSPGHFAEKFRSIGRRVVFAAERFCDTEACRKAEGGKEGMDRLAPEGNPYRYLNAGMMAAKAKDAVPFLKEVAQYMEENNVDDQAAAVHTMLSLGNRHDVTLDYNSALFGVISPALEHYYKDWMSGMAANGMLITRRGTKTHPTALHFAGMRYENNPDQRFNPCQRFQMMTYNSILSKLKPHVVVQRENVTVVAAVGPYTTSENVRAAVRSLQEQTLPPQKIYVPLPNGVPMLAFEDPTVTAFYVARHTDVTPLEEALIREPGNATLIFTFHPRNTYPPHVVQDLVVQHFTSPHSVLGHNGFVIPPNGDVMATADSPLFSSTPQGVDVLDFGVALYKRGFFPQGSPPPVPVECERAGQTWIAVDLAQRGIPLVKVPPRSPSIPQEAPPIDIEQVAQCTRKFASMFRRLSVPEPCAVGFVSLAGLDTPQVGGRAPWWHVNSTTAPCNLTPPS